MRLADTSFLVGLIEEDDSHHQNALTILEDVQTLNVGPIIVGEAVARETLQVMERRYSTPQPDAAVALYHVCITQPFRCDPAVLRALREAAVRPALGFVDALLAEQALRAGAELLSFDRRLLGHMERLRSR